MKINLREEATAEYTGLYQKYLEDVQKLNKNVTDVLNNVLQQSKYDVLQKLISDIIDAYMETIAGNIENDLFSNWVDSNGSLRSCLKTYRAGDAADAVCAQIEKNMRDLMEETLRIEKADLIVTDRPVVSESGLNELEGICKKAQTDIQTIKSNYLSQVNDRSDENEIFGTLEPLFVGIASYLEKFFEASSSRFVKLHEFVTEVSNDLRKSSEEYSSVGSSAENRGGNGSVSASSAPEKANNSSERASEEKAKNNSESNIADSAAAAHQGRAIFITGNGFDRAHDLKSKYADFREYLKGIGIIEKTGIEIIEKIIDIANGELSGSGLNDDDCLQLILGILDTTQDKEWSTFEASLNIKKYIYDLIDKIKSGYVKDGKLITPMASDSQGLYNLEENCAPAQTVYNTIDSIISSALSSIKSHFAAWAKTLASQKPVKKTDLSKIINELKNNGSIFLTFNYTNTLEAMYGVDNVTYIHGSATKAKDELVVGFVEEKLLDDYAAWINGEKTIDDIKNIINDYYVRGCGWADDIRSKNAYVGDLIEGGLLLNLLRKNCEEIIEKCDIFRADLSGIQDIYIYGLSVSVADQPYIMKILKEVGKNGKSPIKVYISNYDFNKVGENTPKSNIENCASKVGVVVEVLNMETGETATFDNSLQKSVIEASAQPNNADVKCGSGSASDRGISNKAAKALSAIATEASAAADAEAFVKFKKLTSKLYDLIYKSAGSKKKEISYDSIARIMPIYKKFYNTFGQALKDKFESQAERAAFVDKEYIAVTRERNNDQFFDGNEVLTFKSHACTTYKVFDRVADMEKNIANACKLGNADDINLMYGAYVLFTPIMEGHIDSEYYKDFSKFSATASREILNILGIDSSVEKPKQTVKDSAQDANIKFEGEKFSEENIRLFVVVVEKIVNQVGVDKLNSSVEKHYNSLRNSRNAYSKKAVKSTSSDHGKDLNTYGRYTVTKKSIQLMAPICSQADSILEPIDKFYKEKFKSLGDSFDKANSVIHSISSFCGLWGLGTWNLSKLFSSEDSDSTILEKIQLGGVALASCTTAGKIINGGASLLKIMDWAIPYLKKSKILVKLNEKVWNLTRQDIQIPYIHKLMDQYMMEHYELNYGIQRSKYSFFEYLHDVVATIKDDSNRRAYENAVFAAEEVLPLKYNIAATNPEAQRALFCGVYLNLVRSGLCSKQGLESKTANEIVDKLYDVYKTKEKILPRVDISPDQEVIK